MSECVSDVYFDNSALRLSSNVLFTKFPEVNSKFAPMKQRYPGKFLGSAFENLTNPRLGNLEPDKF